VSRRMACTALAACLSLVSGCAVSPATHVVVQPISQGEQNVLRISDVTAETAWGVTLLPEDLQRIVAKVRLSIVKADPTLFVPPSHAASKLRVVVTQYASGDQVPTGIWDNGVRGNLQMTVAAFIVDADTKTIGQYQISKTVQAAGIVGGATTMGDVENEIADAIAEIFKSHDHGSHTRQYNEPTKGNEE
jgi:hypothetical protein